MCLKRYLKVMLFSIVALAMMLGVSKAEAEFEVALKQKNGAIIQSQLLDSSYQTIVFFPGSGECGSPDEAREFF